MCAHLHAMRAAYPERVHSVVEFAKVEVLQVVQMAQRVGCKLVEVAGSLATISHERPFSCHLERTSEAPAAFPLQLLAHSSSLQRLSEA